MKSCENSVLCLLLGVVVGSLVVWGADKHDMEHRQIKPTNNKSETIRAWLRDFSYDNRGNNIKTVCQPVYDNYTQLFSQPNGRFLPAILKRWDDNDARIRQKLDVEPLLIIKGGGRRGDYYIVHSGLKNSVIFRELVC